MNRLSTSRQIQDLRGGLQRRGEVRFYEHLSHGTRALTVGIDKTDDLIDSGPNDYLVQRNCESKCGTARSLERCYVRVAMTLLVLDLHVPATEAVGASTTCGMR